MIWFLDRKLNVDKSKARYSVLSAGVPGTVAGLLEAHRRYGRLPIEKLIQPAIELANYLPMTFSMAESLNRRRNYLSKSIASKRNYYKKDGTNWTITDAIEQKKSRFSFDRYFKN